MDDPRMNETRETGESQSEVSEVARQLDEATYEPEAQVEATSTFEQAEAIEATFVDVVQTTDEVSATPITLPSQPEQTSEAGGATLAPDEKSGDEAAGFAETLPDDRMGDAPGGPSELADPSQMPNLEDQLPQEELPGARGGIPGSGPPVTGEMPGDMPGIPGSGMPGGTGEMPGGEMPGDLPGMGDGVPGDLPGFGGSDVPGDIRGGMGGGLPDGMGGEIPGGFGFGDIGGWDNPFGDPSGGGLPGGMGGMGGMPGGDDPGGGFPGGGMPGRPGYGELMDGGGGGGGGGGSMFWSWNLNPGQQGRFERGREITEMNEAQQDLNYDENWAPDPAVGEGDLIDPFTGNYEEWGEATSSDYDEVEKDQENFAQAQRDMAEEKEKQKEAKEQRESDDDDDDDDDNGGDDDNKESAQAHSAVESTTPDDEGGGGGATIREAGRFHWERLGGLLVFDPPRPDMDFGSQAAGYDPGGVSDTAYTPDEEGGGGAAVRPAEAGPKVDPSHVTDPVPGQEKKDQANQGGP